MSSYVAKSFFASITGKATEKVIEKGERAKEEEEDKLYWRGPTIGTTSLLKTNNGGRRTSGSGKNSLPNTAECWAGDAQLKPVGKKPRNITESSSTAEELQYRWACMQILQEQEKVGMLSSRDEVMGANHTKMSWMQLGVPTANFAFRDGGGSGSRFSYMATGIQLGFSRSLAFALPISHMVTLGGLYVRALWRCTRRREEGVWRRGNVITDGVELQSPVDRRPGSSSTHVEFNEHMTEDWASSRRVLNL
ncbi:hypothetical protein C8F04DRAFT_1186292 [Mycena alexandri]|uniref:Uncharacterized protein n=1 Tax=Mycena alexandri TaxID=1745969 RepID=A0AAD6SR76_9AGAR|nr:hypothetical protein C8F04DRAFT_1186292 [Mycena alexandri]